MTKLIGITMGDPMGIGPETVAKAWCELTSLHSKIRIYGDPFIIEKACTVARTTIPAKNIVVTSKTFLTVDDLNDIEAARMTMVSIDSAIEDAISGKIAGIVTAPVNKSRMRIHSKDFIGHTEHLAKMSKTDDVTMMFISENAQVPAVSLVTTHLPHSNVSSSLTETKILETIRKTTKAVKKIRNLENPRIAVLSLNPHCGDKNTFGTEESDLIKPAVERAIGEGINCTGPLSADGLFAYPDRIDFDAVVAMYHDQGMLPIKILGGERTVNLTLGLPFVRTSPSHGTAEHIAWQGDASAKSLIASIKLAVKLTEQK